MGSQDEMLAAEEILDGTQEASHVVQKWIALNVTVPSVRQHIVQDCTCSNNAPSYTNVSARRLPKKEEEEQQVDLNCFDGSCCMHDKPATLDECFIDMGRHMRRLLQFLKENKKLPPTKVGGIISEWTECSTGKA